MAPGTSAETTSGRLVDEVAGLMRERILTGAYGPGEHLRQEAVARDLAVSRTPLREAFRMLEREGLIVLTPGRGAKVVSGDVDTLIDAYRVREVIDGLAARLVARHPQEEALAHLEEVIERQRRTLRPWQPQAYGPLNVEFHGTILKLAGNDYLSRQTSVLHMTANVYVPYRVLDERRVAQAIGEHERILEALRAGDPQAAEAEARSHIATTIRTLLEDQARRPQDAVHLDQA
jgi:DNA-binding GntR family transcriptional regulator